MFEKILVAVDGSEHGLKAAKMAGDLARQTQARVWVVVAFEPLPAYMGVSHMDTIMAARLADTQEILGNALAALGEIPGQVIPDPLEGPAAEAILSVAETREVDLIVMGTRGLGRLASLVMGSTSQKVVSHANCPVLLVK